MSLADDNSKAWKDWGKEVETTIEIVDLVLLRETMLNNFIRGTYQTTSNHYYILIVSKLPSYITPEGKYYPNCFVGIVLDNGLVGVWNSSGDCLTPKMIVGSDGHLDLKSRVRQRAY